MTFWVSDQAGRAIASPSGSAQPTRSSFSIEGRTGPKVIPLAFYPYLGRPPLSSLRKNLVAALASRREVTRMSSTFPPWSTARYR